MNASLASLLPPPPPPPPELLSSPHAATPSARTRAPSATVRRAVIRSANTGCPTSIGSSYSQVEALARVPSPAADQGVEGDRGEDHRAGRERAPVDGDVEVGEPAVDGREQDRSQHRADDGGRAAPERRAADDGGGDRLQLEAGADIRVAGDEEGEAE